MIPFRQTGLDRLARALVRLKKGHALPYQVIGQVGGGEKAPAGLFLHGRDVESEGGDHARECLQSPLDLVNQLEGGGLVLLQVAVVGEGQPLEQGQHLGQHPPTAWAALPRISSAMSGFFFCGMRDEPVV